MEYAPEQQAVNLLRLGDLDNASSIVEQEIRRVADQGNSRELWLCRFVRADILRIRFDAEQALAYLDSLPTPEPNDATLWSKFKLRRGYCMGLLGRYESCKQLLYEAQAVACSAGLLDSQAEVQLARAFIHYRQQEYAAADEIYHSVLELSERIGGWYFRGHGLWGIGKVLMIRGVYDEAIRWLNDSLRVFENAGARLSVATVWSELGVCYLGLGSDAIAMEFLRKAENVNGQLRATHNYQVCLANIGNVYLYRGDPLTAISYYRRALELARQIKDPVSIKKWIFNINLSYVRIRKEVDVHAMAQPAS